MDAQLWTQIKNHLTTQKLFVHAARELAPGMTAVLQSKDRYHPVFTLYFDPFKWRPLNNNQSFGAPVIQPSSGTLHQTSYDSLLPQLEQFSLLHCVAQVEFERTENFDGEFYESPLELPPSVFGGLMMAVSGLGSASTAMIKGGGRIAILDSNGENDRFIEAIDKCIAKGHVSDITRPGLVDPDVRVRDMVFYIRHGKMAKVLCLKLDFAESRSTKSGLTSSIPKFPVGIDLALPKAALFERIYETDDTAIDQPKSRREIIYCSPSQLLGIPLNEIHRGLTIDKLLSLPARDVVRLLVPHLLDFDLLIQEWLLLPS